MTLEVGFLGQTQKIGVTDTAPVSPFTASDPEYKRNTYNLIADTATVHIARNTDATTSDLLLPQNTLVEIDLWGPDTLSYITDTGTANLYMTKKD